MKSKTPVAWYSDGRFDIWLRGHAKRVPIGQRLRVTIGKGIYQRKPMLASVLSIFSRIPLVFHAHMVRLRRRENKGRRLIQTQLVAGLHRQPQANANRLLLRAWAVP